MPAIGRCSHDESCGGFLDDAGRNAIELNADFCVVGVPNVQR